MSLQCFVCETCGTQYAASLSPPVECAICQDERQYVGAQGQKWMTLEQLRQRHRLALQEEEPGLLSLHAQPKLGIGQRAFVVQTPAGNMLWDCVSLIDDEIVTALRALGGLAGIAISHPHYYSSMVEWSHAFGNIPVYLHRDDSRWVMRPDACLHFWEGEQHALGGGLTLRRIGGHFAGFQVLSWPSGAGGKGVLLAGDQPYVCADPRWVSFMYSYPNQIPLPALKVRQIAESLATVTFDRLYGAFTGQLVVSDAQSVVQRSARRYQQALEAEVR